MTDLLAALRSVVGDDGVLDPAAIAERATSHWNLAPMRAAALVRPRSTAEVAAVLQLCHARGQAVVTQGGRTGCVQGQDPDPSLVILSSERLNRIEEIDPVGRTAIVQAGVVLQALQEAVKDHGLLFPVDLGARGSCTVGGNVATNAGGIGVIRYGMMREQVLGLEAVLADGTVVSSMNRMIKNNAGYDLKQLFIGSEGTLGVVTRVVVKLQEAPTSRNTALVALSSFDKVAGLLKHAHASFAGHLSAYEVMWGDYVREATKPGFHAAPMDTSHAYYVVLETEGADPVADAARFDAVLGEALERELVVDAVVARSTTERRALWSLREDFEALYVRKPVFLYDVSLPIKDMDAYVRDVQARLKTRWPDSRCDVLGHVGDGNLHFFVHPAADGDRLHEQADEDVYAPLAAIGGSVSAEHGIGVEKRAYLGISRNAAEVALMKTLKQALDPKGILNPGRIF